MSLFRQKHNASQASSDKIVRITSFLPNLNIGTLLFGTILIYILITLILYLTQEHIASYEVVEGSISGNYRYSALAIKEEEIETSEISGNITYYAREGTKANAGMVICSVTEEGETADESAISSGMVTELSAEDMENAKDVMSVFAINFDNGAFSEVYDFESNIQSIILQSSISENSGSYISNSYEAPVSGFIVYSTDSFEDITVQTLSSDLFSRSSYTKQNLRLRSVVSTGDPIYKLVTNDIWQLCFPVSDSLMVELEGLTKIRVRFLKDNSIFSAPIEIVQCQDGTYGVITMSSLLVSYVTDRYLDIELIMNRVEGLKIPTSAIAEKVFVRIPEEYVTVNEDIENEVYLVRETFAQDGSSSTSNVTATVYSKDSEKGYYLIDPDLFEDGDFVIMQGSSLKYQITDDAMETVQGVYNINKGYAIFREVTIIDENEEFCIVDPDDVYGLSAHDRIVLDADKVKSNEIVL